uniref:hypothetical protein n=1 Tax=Thauera sp. SDU_THAU2 TaxID=3136633 RepID=UPI00311D4382
MLALVDGEGEDALAEQLMRGGAAFRDRRVERGTVEAGIGAHVLRRGEIRDEEIDRPVALGLDNQLALELERGAEQHRQRDRLGQQPGDRQRIIVPSEDAVQHGAELDGATAHVQALDLERQDMIVAGESGLAEFGDILSHRHLLLARLRVAGANPARPRTRQAFHLDFARRAARIIPYRAGMRQRQAPCGALRWPLDRDGPRPFQGQLRRCRSTRPEWISRACRRFSASSKTTDWGPSITSSVTSSPRCAGRQCMKSASLVRARHQRGVDLVGLEDVVAAGTVLLVHGDPGIGDDHVRAGGRRLGIDGRAGSRRHCRAPS